MLYLSNTLNPLLAILYFLWKIITKKIKKKKRKKEQPLIEHSHYNYNDSDRVSSFGDSRNTGKSGNEPMGGHLETHNQLSRNEEPLSQWTVGVTVKGVSDSPRHAAQNAGQTVSQELNFDANTEEGVKQLSSTNIV